MGQVIQFPSDRSRNRNRQMPEVLGSGQSVLNSLVATPGRFADCPHCDEVFDLQQRADRKSWYDHDKQCKSAPNKPSLRVAPEILPGHRFPTQG
jgi:hypothetical protein